MKSFNNCSSVNWIRRGRFSVCGKRSKAFVFFCIYSSVPNSIKDKSLLAKLIIKLFSISLEIILVTVFFSVFANCRAL